MRIAAVFVAVIVVAFLAVGWAIANSVEAAPPKEITHTLRGNQTIAAGTPIDLPLPAGMKCPAARADDPKHDRLRASIYAQGTSETDFGIELVKVGDSGSIEGTLAVPRDVYRITITIYARSMGCSRVGTYYINTRPVDENGRPISPPVAQPTPVRPVVVPPNAGTGRSCSYLHSHGPGSQYGWSACIDHDHIDRIQGMWERPGVTVTRHSKASKARHSPH